MADTWNHKTIISPDDALYIDGELIVKGNIVQIETTQIINKLESNTLIINSDGSQGDNGQYAIPQLALKYDYSNDLMSGWGMMHYRANDLTQATDAGLGYMRFSTVGYPVNGAIQIEKIHTMPNNTVNSESNIGILEGNLWTGNAGAAYALTSAVTIDITSSNIGAYTDIKPVSDTFIDAGDTVSLTLDLDETGVTPGIYGANVSTQNRISVDVKGRISNVINSPIAITFDQVTGGIIAGETANSIYNIFSAGTGLTFPVAYTMAKYTMSMCVLGMAEEFKPDGIAVNALWPRTAIATAAVQNHLGGDEIMKLSRNVDIMADSAYSILTKDSKSFTGNFCIDDLVLYEDGVRDFSKYASVPFDQLMPDFFVPDDTPLPDEIKNS